MVLVPDELADSVVTAEPVLVLVPVSEPVLAAEQAAQDAVPVLVAAVSEPVLAVAVLVPVPAAVVSVPAAVVSVPELAAADAGPVLVAAVSVPVPAVADAGPVPAVAVLGPVLAAAVSVPVPAVADAGPVLAAADAGPVLAVADAGPVPESAADSDAVPVSVQALAPDAELVSADEDAGLVAAQVPATDEPEDAAEPVSPAEAWNAEWDVHSGNKPPESDPNANPNRNEASVGCTCRIRVQDPRNFRARNARSVDDRGTNPFGGPSIHPNYNRADLHGRIEKRGPNNFPIRTNPSWVRKNCGRDYNEFQRRRSRATNSHTLACPSRRCNQCHTNTAGARSFGNKNPNDNSADTSALRPLRTERGTDRSVHLLHK